jgi:hypothetical protein
MKSSDFAPDLGWQPSLRGCSRSAAADTSSCNGGRPSPTVRKTRPSCDNSGGWAASRARPPAHACNKVRPFISFRLLRRFGRGVGVALLMQLHEGLCEIVMPLRPGQVVRCRRRPLTILCQVTATIFCCLYTPVSHGLGLTKKGNS